MKTLRSLLHEILNQGETIVAQIDDLNTQIDQLHTNIQTVAGQVQAELDALQAKITAGGAVATDLTQQISNLQALNTQLLAIGQQVPTPHA